MVILGGLVPTCSNCRKHTHSGYSAQTVAYLCQLSGSGRTVRLVGVCPICDDLSVLRHLSGLSEVSDKSDSSQIWATGWRNRVIELEITGRRNHLIELEIAGWPECVIELENLRELGDSPWHLNTT